MWLENKLTKGLVRQMMNSRFFISLFLSCFLLQSITSQPVLYGSNLTGKLVAEYTEEGNASVIVGSAGTIFDHPGYNFDWNPPGTKNATNYFLYKYSSLYNNLETKFFYADSFYPGYAFVKHHERDLFFVGLKIVNEPVEHASQESDPVESAETVDITYLFLYKISSEDLEKKLNCPVGTLALNSIILDFGFNSTGNHLYVTTITGWNYFQLKIDLDDHNCTKLSNSNSSVVKSVNSPIGYWTIEKLANNYEVHLPNTSNYLWR